MSEKEFHLPPLPGHQINPTIGKNYFGKRQYFTVTENMCKFNDVPKEKPIVYKLFSQGKIPDLPFWLLFDKKILTFYGNFQNAPPANISFSNMRPIKIMFYLEDGTMKIIEPKTNNSGLYQGTIIGRQRIHHPDREKGYYEITDLNIGKEIEVYGKKFLIMNCDEFTKKFLYRLGVGVPEPLKYDLRENIGANRNQSAVKKIKKALQFLQNDGMILRFVGYWDDKSSEEGTLHNLELLYYLSDDSIEIREIFPTKSKGEYGAVFLKRGPLPKANHRPVIGCDSETIETYKASDLGIGIPINVYSRLVILTACDPYTKEYYRSKYGIENMDPIPLPQLDTENSFSHKRGDLELPPWNGHGSHADSAGNCYTMEPKAPRCDFFKFLHKDRFGSNSHILRFKARMVSDIADDDMRKFIVAYYLKDDTISVFEISLRNSGYRTGMFFKRDSVFMPDQDKFTSYSPVCYSVKDMWVGNILIINNYRFLLVGADDYTLDYMENHSNEFPKSNITLILNKIRDRLSSQEHGFKNFVADNLQYLHPTKRNLMPVQYLEKTIKHVAGDLMEEQEFLTITRYFEMKDENNKNEMDNIRSCVNTYLSRNLWQDNCYLRKHFEYLSEKDGNGFSKKEIKQILKANKLPLPDELMDEMLEVIQTNKEGLFEHENIMDFLNYELKPAQMIIPQPAKTTKYIQRFSVPPEEIPADIFINWDVFVEALNLEHTLSENP